MAVLRLDARGKPAHWVLVEPGRAALHIPVTARGADQLFDAFLHLEGLDTTRMLRLLQEGEPGAHLIWERTEARAARQRLN